MARLSKTQQERNARLKALITHVPEGTDIHRLIFDFMSPKNALTGKPLPSHAAGDRHAAIACAAAIEHGLKHAIGLYLADDADAKTIFDDFEAPLGAFSSRTVMARALGVIDANVAADLDVVRRVRNTFAHSVLPIAFGEPDDIAHLVAEIKIIDDPFWRLLHSQSDGPRDRYVVSCGIHYAALLAHRPRPRVSAVEHAVALAEEILASPRKPPLPPLPDSESLGRSFGFEPPPPSGSQE
jgi:hypothetical protein